MKKKIVSAVLCVFSIHCMESQIPAVALAGIQKHALENGWEGNNGWGLNYYDVLPSIVNQRGYKTVLEIGVGLGGHAEYILKNTLIDCYFGIDPYIPFDTRDGFQKDVGKYSSFSVRENFNYLYQWVRDYRLYPFGARCCLIREDSSTASRLFENESLDCIFVDGNNRYDSVLEDLKKWFPKLKKGGMMLGDDYWMQPVRAAVDKYSQTAGVKVFFILSKTGYKIWAIEKQS